MADLFDSLRLMADYPLTQLPYNDMDSLLLASLCYNRLGEDLCGGPRGMLLCEIAQKADLSPWAHLPYSRERELLLRMMAASRRWGLARICFYVDMVDPTLPMQFSAMTAVLPGGPSVICFRGTDNSLTGWREDLYMSFESPVPGQHAAAVYLETVMEQLQGPVVLTGHSKGGSLGFYAMITAALQHQDRIIGAWSFDGPGLTEDMVQSEAYCRVQPRLHSFLPQGSIIGVLMTQQERHTLITSTAKGARQHDVFSWVTNGISLVQADRSSVSSRLTDKTMHTFMKECTPRQRRIVVDAVFDLLDVTEASTLTDLKTVDKAALARVAKAAMQMDKQTYQAFLHIAGALLQSGAGSVAEMLNSSLAAGELKQLMDGAVQTAAPLLKQLGRSAGSLMNTIHSAITQGPKDGKEPHS